MVAYTCNQIMLIVLCHSNMLYTKFSVSSKVVDYIQIFKLQFATHLARLHPMHIGHESIMVIVSTYKTLENKYEEAMFDYLPVNQLVSDLC